MNNTKPLTNQELKETFNQLTTKLQHDALDEYKFQLYQSYRNLIATEMAIRGIEIKVSQKLPIFLNPR